MLIKINYRPNQDIEKEVSINPFCINAITKQDYRDSTYRPIKWFYNISFLINGSENSLVLHYDTKE